MAEKIPRRIIQVWGTLSAGSFYFDTDVFLASSLENLSEFGCVFPFEHLSVHSFLCEQYGMDWEVGNYAFGVTAGHRFSKQSSRTLSERSVSLSGRSPC
jgi:hypothetical protein